MRGLGWVGFGVSSLLAGLAGWGLAAVLLVALSLAVFLPLGIRDPYDAFVLGIYAVFQVGAMALLARRFFRAEGRVPGAAWVWVAVLGVAVPALVHMGAGG